MWSLLWLKKPVCRDMSYKLNMILLVFMISSIALTIVWIEEVIVCFTKYLQSKYLGFAGIWLLDIQHHLNVIKIIVSNIPCTHIASDRIQCSQEEVQGRLGTRCAVQWGIVGHAGPVHSWNAPHLSSCQSGASKHVGFLKKRLLSGCLCSGSGGAKKVSRGNWPLSPPPPELAWFAPDSMSALRRQLTRQQQSIKWGNIFTHGNTRSYTHTHTQTLTHFFTYRNSLTPFPSHTDNMHTHMLTCDQVLTHIYITQSWYKIH